jgi:hypothetical protein
MSYLRKKYHLNVDVKKPSSNLAKCTICELLKDLIFKVGNNSVGAKEYEMKLRKYNSHQKSCRPSYHTWKIESI